MNSSLSVYNENFSGDGQEFKEVSRAVRKADSHLHWQFIGIWQILWRVILESLYIYASPFRDEWDCRKSCTQSWKKERLTVLLQSGLDEKWWADSMECYGYLWNVSDILVADIEEWEKMDASEMYLPRINA